MGDAKKRTARAKASDADATSLWTILGRFFEVDPRTLALFRVAFAGLLLADWIKRWSSRELWYAPDGLLPLEPLRPQADQIGLFSWFWHIDDPIWIDAAFVGSLVVYLALLFGVFTRVAQVLALLSLVCLQARTNWLCNGGDFVFCALAWWTCFLPLGERFSVDAWRRSRHVDPTSFKALQQGPVRKTAPIHSVAMLFALLQLSVIYFFNAVHKDGPTWREGSAIHFFLQQERILTPIGLWAREHLPYRATVGMTYGALIVEFVLPLLILSPVYRTRMRRLAIASIFALHIGIALFANLGVFSPVMCVYAMLLWTAADWERLQTLVQRRLPTLTVYVVPSALKTLRLDRIARLDVYERIRFRSARRLSDPPSGPFSLLVGAKRPKTDRAAVPVMVQALGTGARLAAWLGGPVARWIGLAREAPAYRPRAVFEPPGFLKRHGFSVLSVPLAALALVQVLNENPAIPPAVRVEETPKWFDQAIWATRLRQGWRMFAPDAPLTETTVVIEATTVGGRRFDPLQEVAADDDTIVLDRVIVQPGYDVYWTSFTFRAPGNSVMRNALKRWIERYPDRTGRADDAIASYVGYVVTQRSPGPHGKLPHAIRVRPFMRGP